MRCIRPGLVGTALLILLSVSGCGTATSSGTDTERLRSVAPFEMTERSGATVRGADLKGKVWVAAFVFTCCNQACPIISKNMEELQTALAGQPDVVLVSFSVNPGGDDLETLRQYADSYHADPQRWLFLRGEETAVYHLIRDSFELGVQQNQGRERTPGNEVMHSNKLVLVDPQGRIRGYYDGTDPQALAELRQKIAVLVSPLPLVNASLNAASALLLVLGYVAVRRRRISLHRTCMLMALGVSAVFLASYLYYHLAICHGQPTRFRGEGWPRTVYFAVLLSHTLLAAAAAPLALFTAYQGLRDRLARHVRVARWTLPIWLYVSVTGVVVYVMLYWLYPST